jgi:dipeptidyl aminopeptidase/acylaminoacyl peptidase
MIWIRRLFLWLAAVMPLAPLRAAPPQTIAETSGYTATSRHADVMEFCQQLAKESALVRLTDLGTTAEGRKLPLVIIADPPVSTAEDAARSKKLVVLAVGNIHAGEVDGKEALLMLARDVATASERPLLKDLVLVFAPIFNADGNERLGNHRPTQAGPAQVGTRANAQDLDLNRDFVKLETPEVRALVRAIDKWDPAVFIDLHTTNGSHHRFTMTYEGGRSPAGDSKIIDYTRDELLPDAGRRMKTNSGYDSFFYGVFSRDRRRWEPVAPTPRYGWQYVGLRNRIAVLGESYSYAPFKDRVLASRAFVQGVCESAAKNRDKIRKLLVDARDATTKAGQAPGEKDEVVIRHRPVALGKPVKIAGFVEEIKDGKATPTTTPKDYEAEYFGGTAPLLTVRRPFAYLLPATFNRAVENLQRHGLDVQELREDIELDIEVYRIERLTRLASFQKHQPLVVEAASRKESRRIPAGTILVRTAQSLGSLAVYLLEPQSDDGLTTWNFFDEAAKEGQDFPVLRLPAAAPLLSGKARPLAEDRVRDKPIKGDDLPNFTGSPVGATWLDDGEHFLQSKEGRPYKVHATTGRATALHDPDKVAASIASLPTIDKKRAASLAKSPSKMNKDRTASLFTHDNDLYHYRLDGTKAVRLTRTPGDEELATFSPDGNFVAFVRDGNLHVVDVATQTERALTTDGGGLISNGKADWVYFEEIFHRNWHAFWWSPDSKRIAFLRFDDAPVRKFTLVEPTSPRPDIEATPYPKAGAPNPHVQLAVATVAGGTPQTIDLSDYSETAMLVIRAGWTPDSDRVYFYVQDRAQTWLDFCTVPVDEIEPTRLFRESTKAWVEDLGPPTFLKDGSFLLPSERTGWKHLYHFAADGKLIRPVTSGDWELRKLHVVDEEGGWVWFSGTRDSHIAENLYRIKLDGSGLERLTQAAGDHQAAVSPKGNLFIDSHSSHAAPVQVRLYRADGSLARTLDTNPVYVIEDYRRGQFELLQIPAKDGFKLEASLLKPPGFDPRRKYPVWFTTYGGPHAPMIRDAWGTGRVRDEMLAQMGFVVFRCDPRSASGKGACSAWTAYRQLGPGELADIETAIEWLNTHPWVDGKRIGMSGHSYGGFMTAYAMTHSKRFAAGIAGAPVTDWRNYDSIYTERYMNTPQENPDGYRKTSVVRAAKNLHGKLLILHGLMDDNVHAQNTIQFVDALQKADKDFEIMVYPNARHGIHGKHYQRLMIDFMKRTLKPEPSP